MQVIKYDEYHIACKHFRHLFQLPPENMINLMFELGATFHAKDKGKYEPWDDFHWLVDEKSARIIKALASPHYETLFKMLKIRGILDDEDERRFRAIGKPVASHISLHGNDRK